MMGKHSHCARIRESGIIVVVRADSSGELVDVAKALQQGGVNIIEITMTTPGALGVIEDVRGALGDDVLVGAGSVLDAETARATILAGAEYIVSPVLAEDVITMAHRYQKVVMPGTFTPTEMFRAHTLGADFVKVFPANIVGPGYLKDVLAPMPHLAIVPTGGISADNIGEYIAAGAAAVGVGSALVKKDWVRDHKFDLLTAAARDLRETVEAARAG
jgi:2-dehydro-3-deoxyphosphogluconate aldolase/(4S)-4-hydroxy-2-oxoglutarate aldolase